MSRADRLPTTQPAEVLPFKGSDILAQTDFLAIATSDAREPLQAVVQPSRDALRTDSTQSWKLYQNVSLFLMQWTCSMMLCRPVIHWLCCNWHGQWISTTGHIKYYMSQFQCIFNAANKLSCKASRSPQKLGSAFQLYGNESVKHDTIYQRKQSVVLVQ